jgi:HK97 family phage prohead protease
MAHPTAYKSVPFQLLELKDARGEWSFSGYASTFGNVDLGGDVMLPGAFAASLRARPKPRLLWQHRQEEPIGVVQSLREDDKGLFGEWKLSRTTRGTDAYTLLKDGAIDSLSIGYLPDESEFTDDGVRKLSAVSLLEVSLVAMPMNEDAVITDVKSHCAMCQAAIDESDAEAKAEWTTAYINDLPDSAFAYIEPGGDKDSQGKTVPRSKRHFPHHDAGGKVDLPHLRNALSRAPQSPFGDRAMSHLRSHAKNEGVGDSGKQLATHADRLLVDMRHFADRYRELTALRARDGRQPGEAVRRAVAEMKALAAQLETVDAPAPGAESADSLASLSVTQLRLHLARKQFERRAHLEHAPV